MARNPRGGDGSAPAVDELVTEAGGRPPRRPRRGERVAGLTTDPTNSPEMRMHNDAARAAVAAHNSGAADSDGADWPGDPGDLLGGGTSRPQVGHTGSSDPSSLSR